MIDQIARQVARLSRAEDSDETSGYCGHSCTKDRWGNVGWYCDNGNVGHSIFAVHPDDEAELLTRLSALDDRAFEVKGIERHPVFDGLRVEMYV